MGDMASSKRVTQGDLGFDFAEVQRLPVSQATRELQKAVSAISAHSELLACLTYHQPLTAKEIRGLLGMSKETSTRRIRQLVKTGVVTKTSFEQDVLYTISSKYQDIVHTTLNS